MSAFSVRGEYQEIGDLRFDLSTSGHSAALCAPATGVYEMQDVDIPETVTGADGEVYNVVRINAKAFSGSSVARIRVPGSVMSIGKEAFADCRSLAELRFEKSESALTLEGWVFPEINDTSVLAAMHFYSGRELLGDSNCWLLQYTNTVSCEWEGIEVLKDFYLGQCKSVNNVVLHEDLRSILGNAFKGCVSLHSLSIPEGVTSIAVYAFDDLSALESITLPSTILDIDRFYYCDLLTDIYIYATEPPTINNDTTPYPKSSTAHGTVHVLADAVDAYKNSSVWGNSSQYTIVGDLDEKADVGIEVELDVTGDGVLYIEGYETDKASSEEPQKIVKVPSGVINVVASPGVDKEIGAFRVQDSEGNLMAYSSRMRGYSLVCEITANSNTKIESEFQEQSVRKLHVIMPQDNGSRMTLSLPHGAPWSLVYASADGMSLHSVLLDESELTFTEGENGENRIEVPDYEGEKTLRLVEIESGSITGLRSIDESGATKLRVLYVDNMLTLSGLNDGETVRVFDTEGRLLHRGEAEGADYSIPATLSGICLISTSTATLKVVL